MTQYITFTATNFLPTTFYFPSRFASLLSGVHCSKESDKTTSWTQTRSS
ncbi:unnamed protein product, partial [Musa textilis]